VTIDAVAGGQTTDWALGFQSVEREYAGHELPVSGRVPDWLDGALVRNGPGRFEVGGERVRHWFDGLGMLTRFAFDDGAVSYSNRFLRSREYRAVTEDGHLAGSQFGTSSRGLLRRLGDLLVPTPTDNANVNVVRLGDRFVAVTETPVGVEFDPVTLATAGRVPFSDLDGQMMTAHPHVDPVREETVTFTTDFGRTTHYRFYRRPNGEGRFRPIGSIPTRRPAYVHSFGLTPGHVVFAEFPFDVNPFRLLLPGSDSFIERYRWRPEAGTRFVVMDRESGAVVAEHTAEPFFAFHHVNAFEDDGALVVDLAAFDAPDVIDALYLDDLESGPLPSFDGRLRRFRLPVGDGEPTAETLYDDGVTLPRIHPGRNTRPYRYVYAQGPPVPGEDAPQRLLKVDTRAGGARAWSEPGTMCGEPVFVPDPGGDREDDGVVCSVVLEAPAERSSLLLLDGRTFEELGRAPLPHVVPFDFHGQFVPAG